MDICFPHHFAAPSLLEENERCNDAVIGCLPPTKIFLQGVIESFNLWLSHETLLVTDQAKAASSRQFVETRKGFHYQHLFHTRDATIRVSSIATMPLLLSLMMTIAAKMSLCHLPAFHTHCELLLLSSIIKPCGSSSTDSFLISNSNKKLLHCSSAVCIDPYFFAATRISKPDSWSML